MSHHRPTRTLPVRAAGALMGASLLAAACGGGNDVAVEEPTTTTTTAEVTTTTAATTTTTEVEELAVAPLTGLPVEDDSVLERPALFVKIDNHPDGRPQSGLAEADLVFEMRAEGVTRLVGVYHTNSPAHVGPIRSSRTSDFDLLRAFDTPLYASSGGNDIVAAAIRQLPVINVTAITRTEYYRDSARRAPHNLYVDTEDLFALAPEDDATPPAPWFTYRDEADSLPARAEPVEGPVTVEWRGRSPVVTFTWDEDRGTWARTQDGRPHTQDDDTELGGANVVLLIADYGVSRADAASPELLSTGEGDAIVLTDGHVITGRWFRPSPEDPPGLFTDDGQEITLTPGHTWVLWPEDGDVSY